MTEETFPGELEELRARLREADETLEAIRSGAVDAIVVSGKAGEKVYTLEGADQSYRLLIESISEGALTLTADGTILYGNGQFARMLGHPLDLVIGTPFLNYVSQSDRTFVERVFHKGTPVNSRFQVILSTREGWDIPVQLSLNVADIGGEKIVTAVITDLTDQIHYQKTVQEEKLLRAILDQDPDGVAVCDTAGRVIRCSRAFDAVCNESPLKRSFDDLLDLHYATGNGSWKRFSPDVPLGGVSLRAIDGKFQCPDGQTRYCLISAGPLMGTGGEVLGCLIVLTDISDRKEMEAHLAEQATRLLEQKVQLMEANKELESFSYSVSHDLRAPLRAIDGYARMITRRQGDRFDEETNRQFGLIRQNAEIMGKLINDLLEFSRLGRKELQVGEIDMRLLLASTWEELQEFHPNRRMTLTMGDLPPAWGDTSLIKQVLINILSNAVKFTRDREEAMIEAGHCTRDNLATYYIRDNGAGFDMQYAKKLFNVFQRLHSAEEFEGTGIGLAIVQRIIKRHGGRAWAEGEVGKGACFYLSLPARNG